VPCFGHRFKPIATESCTGNRRDGRSGDRENPFGASHFQVRASDWNPPRRALGPAANRPGHVTVPDQCRKPSENSCQGAVHTLTQSRPYYRGGRRAAAHNGPWRPIEYFSYSPLRRPARCRNAGGIRAQNACNRESRRRRQSR
jgi:hypothetical protein